MSNAADKLQTAFVTSGTVHLDFAANKVTFKQKKGTDVGQCTVEEFYNAMNVWRRTRSAHEYIASKK
jgi:hypothetical protein